MKIKYLTKELTYIVILLAVFIGSGVAVATKIAIKDIPPFSFTFFRFLIASISILPFFLKTKPKFHKDIYKVILLSLYMTANATLFPLGVRLTTATIASTLYIFGPLFVAVLSYFLLSETFTVKKTVGIMTSFVGALIIILLPEIHKGSAFEGNISGNLLISVAVIATALYTVFSKRFQREYTPIQLTSIFIFTSGVVLIPLAGTDLITHPHWWNNLPTIAILATIFTGVLGTTIWYLLYQYAIKHGSPLIASMILYLQPAATFLLASLLLGEMLTIGFTIGAVLAFIGVYLTLQSKQKRSSH